MDVPDYACAVITNDQDHLLLELRPAHARHAANQLTCFGGRREAQESDHACLLRELHEELNWVPAHVEETCELYVGTRFIARFFACRWQGHHPLRTEAGHVAIWAPLLSLPGLPMSPWHRHVLHAISAGQRCCRCE